MPSPSSTAPSSRASPIRTRFAAPRVLPPIAFCGRGHRGVGDTVVVREHDRPGRSMMPTGGTQHDRCSAAPAVDDEDLPIAGGGGEVVPAASPLCVLRLADGHPASAGCSVADADVPARGWGTTCLTGSLSRPSGRAAGCSTRASTREAMNRAVRTGVPPRVTSVTSTIPRPWVISTRRPLRVASIS